MSRVWTSWFKSGEGAKLLYSQISLFFLTAASLNLFKPSRSSDEHRHTSEEQVVSHSGDAHGV